ncbi:MAG: SPFH domain-containing protein, partial [Myxococcota bacterium]|nr:SPFH domain-containing protein [Myxococcota bacterium]
MQSSQLVLVAASQDSIIVVGVIIAFVVLLLIGLAVIIAKFYRKVDQGKALIINKMRAEPEVTFTGGVVYPIIHRAEVMDISVKTIEIDRRGPDGLVCKDNIRADIKVTFFVRVNKSKEDVLKVAQSIGCARASDHGTMENLFVAKFSEALKTVGKRLEFEELYTLRAKFRDDIIEIIGQDLNGYKLEDAAIDYLEQTPLEHLEKDNILDAQGIRKITEITTAQNVMTNELKQKERREISKENVAADEAIFELERKRADAAAKRDREIASVNARESATTRIVQDEERAKAESARIKAEEEIAVKEENRIRQIEVTQKNRERVVGIEAERAQKDRELEAIGREHEVQLRTIAKDKAVEQEKKEIADVVAARISVEKSVAEQEEAIKDLRVLADAKRGREARIITAEGDAQEKLVREIKGAQAREEVAKHLARERLTMAEADREAADKTALAKIRLAEGLQAEHAAEGLAAVRVREAQALAVEKNGQAEARVQLLKAEANAEGEEKLGSAKVRVKQAEVEVFFKQGQAEANIIREKLLAEANGEEQKGLA